MGAILAKATRTNRIKSARTYTVPEAAMALAVSVQSVRNWIRTGLPALRTERPTLIRGVDLKDWLRDRARKNRKPLALHEFQCLTCKSPQMPYGGMVDCREQTAHSLILSALCPSCGRTMYRIAAHRQLHDFQQIFDVQFTVTRAP
jgi:hypothetical protein